MESIGPILGNSPSGAGEPLAGVSCPWSGESGEWPRSAFIEDLGWLISEELFGSGSRAAHVAGCGPR